MTLPTLYKQTSTGAIQTWHIAVNGATITTRYGQLDGKIQETTDTVKSGKNQGKANETTPEEQAKLEAEAKHLKQRKKGYVVTLDAAESGAVGEEIEGGLKPMLAKTFEEGGDKIKFPGYVQAKLDGHRCIAHREEGDASLWSRSRKRVHSVPHVAKLAATLIKQAGVEWLDGELYNHDYRNRFQELTSLLRASEPKEGHEVIEYHIYDIPGEGTFENRLAKLNALKVSLSFDSPIQIVESVLVLDEEEMWAAHQKFKVLGYEGTMFRNRDGLYENKRSSNLIKLKDFQDSEFKVIGMEEGRGKLAGHCGAFVCALPDGNSFSAKMVGPTPKLREAWENQKEWMGRVVTVRYMRLTAEGKPFHPRVLRPREDI